MIFINNNLEFQLYDWVDGHDNCEDDDNVGNYIIHIFGRCENGESVYAKVEKYEPYFYIKLPNKLQNKSKQDLEVFADELKNHFNSCKKINSKYKKTLIKLSLYRSKIADGFTNNKEFNFIKLVFNNFDGMKKYSRTKKLKL
jgi:DNA polymerase elongation subunit (family B)